MQRANILKDKKRIDYDPQIMLNSRFIYPQITQISADYVELEIYLSADFAD